MKIQKRINIDEFLEMTDQRIFLGKKYLYTILEKNISKTRKKYQHTEYKLKK